jgi:DNA-binding transcriptional LysR family regulator
MKRSSLLNYHQIELLYQVVRTGTVTAAANALHISQPAVTKQLRLLEESLELRLFVRMKGRLVPTAEALLLTEQVERTHASLSALGELADRLRNGSGGHVSICAPPAIADRLLPKAVSLFQRQFPKVLVDVAIENTLRMLDLVESQQVDIAICATSRTTSHISETPLLTSRLLFAVAPDDPLANLPRVRLKDVGKAPFTVVEALESVPQVREALRLSGIQPQISARVSSSSFACHLVRLNKTRALVDSITAASFVGPDIVFIELPDLPKRQIALLKPQMRSPSDFIEHFSNILVEQAKDPFFNKPPR